MNYIIPKCSINRLLLLNVVDGARVVLVREALSTTSAQEIMRVDSAYTGAQLILGKVPKAHDVYYVIMLVEYYYYFGSYLIAL